MIVVYNRQYCVCFASTIPALLGSYIHACIKKTHSIANLQNLTPTLAGINIGSTNQPKLGLNLVENVFYLCMHGCN